MSNYFHLSLPCENLVETKMFYVDIIGAFLGRYSKNWLDINLFGHQLTFTKTESFTFKSPTYKFDNNILPTFHFGIITDIDTWGKTYSNLISKNIEVSTKTSFLKDSIGEHLSFFVEDPNGYFLEFKCFKNSTEIFTS